MSVKRYTFGYVSSGDDRYLGCIEKTDGPYVLYTDYAVLEDKVAGLGKDAERWRKLRSAPNNSPDSGVEVVFWKNETGSIVTCDELDRMTDALTQPEQDDE